MKKLDEAKAAFLTPESMPKKHLRDNATRYSIYDLEHPCQLQKDRPKAVAVLEA
jgi:hypothetical protein